MKYTRCSTLHSHVSMKDPVECACSKLYDSLNLSYCTNTCGVLLTLETWESKCLAGQTRAFGSIATRKNENGANSTLQNHVTGTQSPEPEGERENELTCTPYSGARAGEGERLRCCVRGEAAGRRDSSRPLGCLSVSLSRPPSLKRAESGVNGMAARPQFLVRANADRSWLKAWDELLTTRFCDRLMAQAIIPGLDGGYRPIQCCSTVCCPRARERRLGL